MNRQEARERLEALVENSTTGVDIMVAADVLILAVHVEACMNTLHDDQNGIRKTCGDGWYCGKAPRR